MVQQQEFNPQERKQKIKQPVDYLPKDFAQMFHALLPFKHEHKKNKSVIERNSLSLTNKFAHEGEFAEE